MTDADDVELTFTVGEVRRISELVTQLASWCFFDGEAYSGNRNNGCRKKALEAIERLKSYGVRVSCDHLRESAE